MRKNTSAESSQAVQPAHATAVVEPGLAHLAPDLQNEGVLRKFLDTGRVAVQRYESEKQESRRLRSPFLSIFKTIHFEGGV